MLLIDGNSGAVGVFIEKRPTNRDGWVDVYFQSPATSFKQFVGSLFKKPVSRIRNVPEAGILGPIVVGSADEQKQILFLMQGENGNSEFLDQTKIFHNKTIQILRQQLQDEIIRSQAADEEKRSALRGVQQTQKMFDDIKGTKSRKLIPGRRSEYSEDDDY